MNRREFLRPQRLSTELRTPSNTERTASENPVLLRFGRRAMATTFEVILPFDTPAASEVAEEAFGLVDRLEDQLTVFREHSEVSLLNRRAAREAVVVEKELFELLVLAKQIHQETSRAFDITIGALTKAWGFFRRAGRVPVQAELRDALGKVGLAHVDLQADKCAVAYRREGIEINLGSIGKGYALDRLIRMLWKDRQVQTALIHGGQSSIFALGNEPGSDRGWPVTLSDPRDPDRNIGLFRLRNRALGTSSATYQHLIHEGRRLGHILDPRTGWPAEGLLSATVTAPTAAVADALATAFFILGVEGARQYCGAHPEVGAVLVPQSPNPRPIVLGRASSEFAPTSDVSKTSEV